MWGFLFCHMAPLLSKAHSSEIQWIEPGTSIEYTILLNSGGILIFFQWHTRCKSSIRWELWAAFSCMAHTSSTWLQILIAWWRTPGFCLCEEYQSCHKMKSGSFKYFRLEIGCYKFVKLFLGLKSSPLIWPYYPVALCSLQLPGAGSVKDLHLLSTVSTNRIIYKKIIWLTLNFLS